ncbi:hypothetical protein CBS101457_003821 [Exobasidium rhododendri]|nr:hypothetical protein CBS101457_003821 [Exobasidium rhododendri]
MYTCHAALTRSSSSSIQALQSAFHEPITLSVARAVAPLTTTTINNIKGKEVSTLARRSPVSSTTHLQASLAEMRAAKEVIRRRREEIRDNRIKPLVALAEFTMKKLTRPQYDVIVNSHRRSALSIKSELEAETRMARQKVYEEAKLHRSPRFVGHDY